MREVVVYYKELLDKLSKRSLHYGWTERDKAVYDKLYDWYIYEVYINSVYRSE